MAATAFGSGQTSFDADAFDVRRTVLAQAAAVRALRYGAALTVDMVEVAICEGELVRPRGEGARKLDVPLWVQLLTRWPRTQASQAYFSPSA